MGTQKVTTAHSIGEWTSGDRLQLTVTADHFLKDITFVHQHLQLVAGVEAMLGSQQETDAGLDISLLFKELSQRGVNLARSSCMVQ